MATTYELLYWPVLPGRGEFPRLIFEDAGVAYVDVGRLPEEQGGGFEAIRGGMGGQGEGFPVFAPPMLIVEEDGRRERIAQMPNICHFLGVRLGLAPEGALAQAQALTLMLTIADVTTELHDCHHPLGKGLYYEDQKEAAVEHTTAFVRGRLPRWLRYFETVLERGDGAHCIGGRHSYVDLALFQLLEGIAWALPTAFAHHMVDAPKLAALRERVAKRERVAAYLASPRRLAFNEHGIFRRYPELDIAPEG